MSDLLAVHTARFDAFVAGYLSGEDKEDRTFRLKQEHSHHVLDNARRIVATPELAPEGAASHLPATLREDALLAAIYHDVGRFPQFQRYQTLHDGKSENHGILGAKTLHREGLLDDLAPQRRAVVRGAVIMHNRKAIPQAAEPAALAATKVTRDADKLDIYRVMLDHFGNRRDDPVVTLNAEDHPTAFSQDIYDTVLAGGMASYTGLAYVNDFKILMCGWLSDLNYRASRKLFQERGLLPAMLSHLPDTEAMRRLGDTLHARLEALLAA